MSPAVLYHPHPATLWVHLSDLQGPVQVRVQLQGNSGTPATTLLRREVLEPHLHLNVTFPVSVTPVSPQTSRQQGGGPWVVSRPFPSAPHRAGSRCDSPVTSPSFGRVSALTLTKLQAQPSHPAAGTVPFADLQGAGGTFLPSPRLGEGVPGVGRALGHPEGARALSLSPPRACCSPAGSSPRHREGGNRGAARLNPGRFPECL